MSPEKMTELILKLQVNNPINRISAGIAKKPEYADRKIFEGVACGIAAACDPTFELLINNKEANIDLMQPEEWLPGAKSVISVFMPFARWIVEENVGGDKPSDAWLHGRIDGQKAINEMSLILADKIRDMRLKAVIPALDPRLKVFAKSHGDFPEYTSNWSERHIAYIAGLGTFGLSHGLITRLGTAGRFMSIVTTLLPEQPSRPYTDLYEYCSKCGACIRACPPGAITADNKDNSACDALLETVKEQMKPYYGCGKCQCGMPCTYGIPGKKREE